MRGTGQGSRTGRRPGTGDTRADILRAARRRFADLGFDRTTIRAIAADAAVDPALVMHYFGSKRELFAASVELPFEPGAVVTALLEGHHDDLGRRLVRVFLTAWDSSKDPGPMLALLRSAAADDGAADMVRDLLYARILRPVAEAVGSSDADFRASLAATQMSGLAIGRYLLRIPPLASAPVEDLVAAIGPTMQRYLVGDL